MISNIQESRARGAMIIALATEGDQEIKKHADFLSSTFSEVRDAFSPIIASATLQLLRAPWLLHADVTLINRNLTKSVTVE